MLPIGEAQVKSRCKATMDLWRLGFLVLAVVVWTGDVGSAEPANAGFTRTLDGVWKLAIDPANTGRDGRWFESIRPEAEDAPVPGIIQQVFPAYHGVAWYWHSFDWTGGDLNGDRALVRFGAVDYLADVWLNGQYAGAYEGGETPFEFDVTDSLKTKGSNLLAVRVLNPTLEPIEGIVLKQIPHRNKAIPHSCGASFNSGGILYPVTLRTVPSIYIVDVFARPDIKTGDIAVTVTVRNADTKPINGTLSLTVAPAAGGDVLESIEQQIDFPAGLSEHEVNVQVDQPHLWNLDDPFLYRVTATVSCASKRPHPYSIRCGFRDFRVVDGYFHLNGTRIFLKSTHTGNHMPVGQQVCVTGDFGRRDLIFAKASGFNMVRFIAGVAYPEQLDFCDELGLMVYEECLAAWCLEDSPNMAERYDHSTSAMICRDRNHPSVTIWGLLNETQDGPVFRQAVGFLPRLRKMDTTRLVLLDSGRWDGQWSIGSVSNPGSNEWEPVWGVEDPNAASSKLGRGGYAEQAGDAHYYPGVPQPQSTDRFICDLGRDSKPVLLSEYGIGSQMNVIDELRHFEQVGARPDLEDATLLREQCEALAADWKRLGFENVYPFPEDFLLESQRLHARQRTIGFNCVRSNSQLCGYNLTGMLDHGMTGEGLWTFWREWKPATFDAVADGWSPVRWCLFVNPLHGYIGREITIEAVLANEDVLKPGEYPASFRIFGPEGPVWEKQILVKIPEKPMLAVPAICETVVLDGPTGQYTFAASLERGGSPTGGRLAFYMSNSDDLPRRQGDIALWGIESQVSDWLTKRGATCHAFDPASTGERELILIGNPADADSNSAFWDGLKQRLEKGAWVLLLNSTLLQQSKVPLEWLPSNAKGTCRNFNDWLYHKDCVAKRHPIFDGLKAPGIMDWDFYGPLIPRAIFEGRETPDDTIAAAFATGNSSYPRGYGSSLLTAAYKSGDGWLIVNTINILENIDLHPAADRLLMNLIRYAQERK